MKRIFWAILVLSLAWSSAAWAESVTHPIISLDEMNRRDEVRFKQEQQDRRVQKAREEAAAEAQQNRERERAYAEGRKARIEKLEKKTGRKVRSWQVLNR